MSNYNLLNSSADLFQKLLSDFDIFKVEFASAYKALDCALSAWHLTDWVFIEYEQATHGSIGIMRDAFIANCPSLKVMHDIATGAKHLTVSRPKSDMAQNHISFEDWYPPVYTATYGNDWLLIDFKDGRIETMYGLLVEVVDFWKFYFEAKTTIPSATT